ncbi:MAG: lanthionine synthetase LanC family protein [Cyclobacteriaceae bacterium]
MKKQLIVYLLITGTIWSCSGPVERDTTYMAEIASIDRWLQHTKVMKDDFQIWPDAIDQPDKVSLSFSDGISGKIIFYLQAYNETQNEKYLKEAAQGSEYVLEHLPQKSDTLQNVFWAFSPYGKVCGPAFALLEMYKATGEDRYKTGAEHIVEVIDHFAVNKQDTLSWDLGNDVLGGLAGTGLFMLYAGETLQRGDLIQVATKAGRTLISRAKKETGLSWKRGQNGRFELPNFSHGAAGIGYFMARLFEATGDSLYLNAALQANTYLESIAKTEGGVFLIPYGFPDIGWSTPYDIGWAHGPAGVARFYRQLYKLTDDLKWKERERACVAGIMTSGVPGPPAAGFGEEEFYLDSRFGIASVAFFLVDFESEEEEHLAFRDTLVKYIQSKSVVEEGRRYWPQVRYSFMANAGDTTAFTGYFYGAAGYGQVLLKAQARLNGTEYIRFVDDPY